MRSASSNLFGVILLLCLLGSALISFNFDALSNLYNACESQWHNFMQGLSMIQPRKPF